MCVVDGKLMTIQEIADYLNVSRECVIAILDDASIENVDKKQVAKYARRKRAMQALADDALDEDLRQEKE